MARFRFRSTWVIDAPRDRLFDALHDYEQWPTWWPGAESMCELEPTGAGGIGGRGRYEWRSPVGYRLRFDGVATAVDRPSRLSGTVEGDLRGSGTWWLFDGPAGATVIVYLWEVEAARTWLRVLSPLLRPVLEANHDRLMRSGASGLARHIGGRLVHAE